MRLTTIVSEKFMEVSSSQISVTFIMPAFNAGDYIGRAIDSVIAQTYDNWKLIIANDASTDDTLKIIKKYAGLDNRISYMDLTIHQGSAYNVRKYAIRAADAEFVSPLDADDWIEPSYLEKLVARLKETNADIVYPLMVNPSNDKIIVPVKEFDISMSGRGKDFVNCTLNGWKIGAGGGLIRTTLYLNLFNQIFKTGYAFSDEYLTRRLLYNANCVAFSDAKYFYFINETSVTHNPTSRLFDNLICDQYLSDFITANYGNSSEEYINIQIQRFFNIVGGLRYLNHNSFRLSKFARLKGRIMIQNAYGNLDWETIHLNISWKYYYMMKFGLKNASRFLNIYDRIFRRK